VSVPIWWYLLTIDRSANTAYLIQWVENVGWHLEHAGWVWAEKGTVGYGGFGMQNNASSATSCSSDRRTNPCRLAQISRSRRYQEHFLLRIEPPAPEIAGLGYSDHPSAAFSVSRVFMGHDERSPIPDAPSERSGGRDGRLD
jgi:hypothetical protein